MKNILLFIFFIIPLANNLSAQNGMWTWMNGDSAKNSTGVFGIQGVPNTANYPPALYEPCEWTDLQGNFWLYGGFNVMGEFNDLWKYNHLTNQWTWIKGTGVAGSMGTFGIKGVPSITNQPPGLAWGVTTWTDTSGNLWMYGGAANSNILNALWKYNIATNMWTWMNGSSGVNQLANYGIMGAFDPSNTPGARCETSASWIDNNNNLWMFGGQNYASFNQFNNDLWKYNPAINQWAWMKGDTMPNQWGNYGIKGVPNISNLPLSRIAYGHWKDNAGNFWMFGGVNALTWTFNDMWMYNPLSNIWTWMSGTNLSNDTGHFGSPCIPSVANVPPARFENRCCWKDSSGRFWMYGGFTDWFGPAAIGDLWMFNPNILEWTFVSGDSVYLQNPVYGSKGIPSPNNKPGERGGTVGWYQTSTNSIFLFGGMSDDFSNPFPLCRRNDLWRYSIDTLCNWLTVPEVLLASSDTIFCEKQCIDFTDLSTNSPTSWQWLFPGADSTTSSLQNPTNICYSTYGSFDVTLIACNGAGCDTLVLLNFINEYQNPTDSIYQSNDTLYSLLAYSYQWYSTTGIIAGATNQFYVFAQPGSYYCIVSDSIGCVASSNTIVATAVSPLSIGEGSGVRFYPNPVIDFINLQIHFNKNENPVFEIYDLQGRIIQTEKIVNQTTVINVQSLSNGVYFIKIFSNEKSLTQKFIVLK